MSALKANTTRTIAVRPLDVFGVYQPRVVVALEGESARLVNSETGRLSVVRARRLQETEHRCSEREANAAIRAIVRRFPALSLKWGLAKEPKKARAK